MAYDPAVGNVVLFGGANGGSDLSDTWTFNGTTWTRLSPATSPPARAYASMAYDPAMGNMVLFGGSGNGGDLNDTWVFSGTTWTHLSPATSPPVRDSASMAYNPASGKIVLFGGEGSGGNLSDTWTFNGTTWTQLSPAVSPPARWYASCAYDPATGNMVLFGGSGNSGDLNDTWTFNGTTWAQLSPATSPPARDSASMAYDPATGNMVLFGGEANSGDLNDTWTFSGTTWTQLAPAVSPPARDSASMAYDPATGNMVLFGGEANSVNLSDTWTFVQTTVTLTQGGPISAIIAYGAGYGGHSLTVANSTGTVSYTEETSTDSTDVVITGTGAISTATSLAPGTYTVGGTDRDTNGDYGTWIFSLTVDQAPQTITFTSTTPSNATVGATYVVSATGGASGSAVTFSTSSMCTVSGSKVSFIGAGECVIDANQAGGADYLPAAQVEQTIAVGKASQTIAFTSTPLSKATVGAIYMVRAAGGASGDAVTFRAKSKCIVSGSKVRLVGVGECIIDASQAGNANYLAATEATQTFKIAKAASRTALRLSATKVTYGREQVERLSVTVLPQSSGVPTGKVTIRESGTTLCTTTLASGKRTCRLSSKKLKAGNYHLVAIYSGNTNFKGSNSARETLTVAK